VAEVPPSGETQATGGKHFENLVPVISIVGHDFIAYRTNRAQDRLAVSLQKRTTGWTPPAENGNMQSLEWLLSCTRLRSFENLVPVISTVGHDFIAYRTNRAQDRLAVSLQKLSKLRHGRDSRLSGQYSVQNCSSVEIIA
jgi:hypothetical protein